MSASAGALGARRRQPATDLQAPPRMRRPITVGPRREPAGVLNASARPAQREEIVERFNCFGGQCAVVVGGSGPAGTPAEAAARVRRRMLAWHEQFTRFDPASELSELNRDERSTVPVSAPMARFVQAALTAADTSGGLVDPTLLSELREAGYAGHFAGTPVPLANALALGPPRSVAGPSPLARWRLISVDAVACTVTRPPGVLIDSGGIAKGLFADVAASVLCGHRSFALDAAGDVRFGGTGSLSRPVEVADPFGGPPLHVFEQVRGAAATSGISKRSWLDSNGVAAHHVLDPSSGRPAFTGVVQATALAPSAAVAEMLAKAALLSGPERARRWLVHGGLVVRDDGSHELVEPAPTARTAPTPCAAERFR